MLGLAVPVLADIGALVIVAVGFELGFFEISELPDDDGADEGISSVVGDVVVVGEDVVDKPIRLVQVRPLNTSATSPPIAIGFFK
jgi:hypothetical protein